MIHDFPIRAQILCITLSVIECVLNPVQRFLNVGASLGRSVGMLRRTQQYIIRDVQNVCYVGGVSTPQRAVTQLVISPDHKIFTEVLTNLIWQIHAFILSHWPAELIRVAFPGQSFTTLRCELVTFILDDVGFTLARANVVRRWWRWQRRWFATAKIYCMTKCLGKLVSIAWIPKHEYDFGNIFVFLGHCTFDRILLVCCQSPKDSKILFPRFYRSLRFVL